MWEASSSYAKMPVYVSLSPVCGKKNFPICISWPYTVVEEDQTFGSVVKDPLWNINSIH